MIGAVPVLWVLAGPNGAGKSTYYDDFVSTIFRAPFVNADRIAEQLWGRHPASDAEMRAATETAERRRAELLSTRTSFVAETVFSHSSKLVLMQDAIAQGFVVRLSYICVDGPELCALRVRGRVAKGGHDVPADKIAARYTRSLTHAKQAVRVAHWAIILDNTTTEWPHRPVLQYESGVLRARKPPLPRWTKGFPGTVA
jgi:predicted ABC-type ATPase